MTDQEFARSARVACSARGMSRVEVVTEPNLVSVAATRVGKRYELSFLRTPLDDQMVKKLVLDAIRSTRF